VEDYYRKKYYGERNPNSGRCRVEELLYQYAEENITDEDFGKERVFQ